jgi:predicted transcriptional regulator
LQHLLHATGVAGESLVIERLPPREREVFDALFAAGEATAAQLEELMPDPPSNSALRIMLGRLEKKGFVRRRLEDQKYVYAPALPERKVKQSALTHMIRTFFNGSPIGAAAALVGMSEDIDEAELQRLEQAIAAARREKSK